MKQIGFEREYFLEDKEGNLVLNPREQGFPVDDFGVLVEARGEPNSNIEKAVLSLLVKEAFLRKKAKELGLRLMIKSYMNLTKKQISEAYALYGKDPTPNTRRNLYGLDREISLKKIYAGLHVHFSNIEKENVTTEIKNYILDAKKKTDWTETETREIVTNNFIDLALIIRHLDDKFKEDIEKTKRTKGEYEIKEHGFEYRSLPAISSIWDVAKESMNILNTS